MEETLSEFNCLCHGGIHVSKNMYLVEKCDDMCTAVLVEVFSGFFVCRLCLLTEMGKPSTKVRVNKVRKSMPFQPDGGPHDSEARGMKAKQRQWMMDGLRAMKEPVALNLKFSHHFCFELSSYV